MAKLNLAAGRLLTFFSPVLNFPIFLLIQSGHDGCGIGFSAPPLVLIRARLGLTTSLFHVGVVTSMLC